MKMEEKPSLEIVYMAISALYTDPNVAEKEGASRWLGDFQKSVHAWTIADELLHHKRDLQSCYFAAQTMRSKIHNSFDELPAEAHFSLRDSLIDHISQVNEATNSTIVIQLCLAIADLILQMPSWPRASMDLINKFSQTHLWPLLEILIVLPEELESKSVRIGENRRKEMLEDLRTCAPMVNELLKQCTSNYSNIHENVNINVKILKCYTSWVSFGAITLADVTENIVVAKALLILSYKQDNDKSEGVVGSLHDSATDCICTLLKCLEDNNNQQNTENYLFNAVLTLDAPYHLSVANEDQEKSMNYCRLFTELGESFLYKIFTQTDGRYQHFAVRVLDLVLMCVGHHDYEVAEISFNLWFLLSEELYHKNSDELTEVFRPYFERLVTALCRHCQMEPDHDGLLDDSDNFKDFRMKVFDLVKDVVFIIGSSSCFRHMFMNLQTPSATWDTTEAALFIMHAVGKNIHPAEEEVVPKVMEAILNISENTHIAVRYTSVLLLGELSNWIDNHPTILDPVLNFLVCCLPQAGVGAAAATSLSNICTSCSSHMARHISVLLQILTQVNTFDLSNNAVNGLLKGVAAVIGGMDYNDIPAAVKELCLLQINPLCQMVEQNTQPSRGSRTDPVMWLDRLSTIFRNLIIISKDEVHPCRGVVIEFWPIISRVLDHYKEDKRIMERGCRSVRFMLRCVSQQVKEILETLVPQIINIYGNYKHSCFLYLGSIVVDEYATDPMCVPGLLDMLQAFITPTFELLQEKDGLRSHPDTVDDFFRLCARCMQRAPLAFLTCSALTHILQCGLMACSVDHREATTSVMKFFYDLVGTGRSGRSQSDFPERAKLVSAILMEYGAQLVTNLVHTCVFYLQTHLLCEVADVIVELIGYNRDMLNKWLAEAVDSLPKKRNGIISVTQQQLNEFHTSVTISDTSKSVTSALEKLAGLYR